MMLKGDCIEVMKAMKPNSMDAIITDPPYGLEFMGKKWDKLWDKREFGKTEYSKKSFTCSDGSTRKTNPVTRNLKNPNYKAGLEAQLWHTQWLTEAYRVLKPGGSMLVMGGTRTFHRLACAIEDSGFIIKDTLMWLYGSGFPKAQDLGKMIDKRAGKERTEFETRPIAYPDSDCWGTPNKNSKQPQWGIGSEEKHKNQDGKGNVIISKPATDLAKHWDGFKVGGIKPAYEPIIWAVKPPEGSYIDNVLKWGVGAINVDECRVGTDINRGDRYNGKPPLGEGANIKFGKREQIWNVPKGRFPANVILSHHPECVQVGMKRVRGSNRPGPKGFMNDAVFNIKRQRGEVKEKYGGPETVESWDCHPDCAVRLLDEQSGELKSGARTGQVSKPATSVYGKYKGRQLSCEASSGGASRFFYCAKASRAERNAGLDGMENKPIALNTGNAHNVATLGRETKYQNNHPTVKPIKLFEWLIKLVTREGQIILDPFIGSGTTAIATHNTGRKCMGIEKEPEYLEIAKRRTAYWRSRPRQLEMIGG